MVTTTPIDASEGVEPVRKAFTEKPLKDEPKSDVKIVVNGMILRERVTKFENDTGISFLYTYTRLDNNDNVMLDNSGAPMIFNGHEHSLLGENIGRSTDAEIKESIKLAREVGAARAENHFVGLEKMSSLFTSRL